MKRSEIPPEVESLFSTWPQIERSERRWRRWDWAWPACCLGLIAINFNGSWPGQIACILVAFLVGVTTEGARWRRRSFRRMKEGKEQLQIAIAMHLEVDDDEEATE